MKEVFGTYVEAETKEFFAKEFATFGFSSMTSFAGAVLDNAVKALRESRGDWEQLRNIKVKADKMLESLIADPKKAKRFIRTIEKDWGGVFSNGEGNNDDQTEDSKG
jgi:hypothetical protein